MLCVIGRLRNRDGGGFSSKYGAVSLYPFLIFRLVGSRPISSFLVFSCFPSNTSPLPGTSTWSVSDSFCGFLTLQFVKLNTFEFDRRENVKHFSYGRHYFHNDHLFLP